jgi:hypothetical protein
MRIMLPCNARLRFVILGTLWLLGTATLSAAAERLASDETVAPRTATPPQIDGDLSDPAWQTAARVDSFVDPQTGGAPFRATWMKALHDDRYLYLAVWCAEPHPESLKAVGKPDDGVWEDDCLEVFLGHTAEPGEHVHLITNTKDVH